MVVVPPHRRKRYHIPLQVPVTVGRDPHRQVGLSTDLVVRGEGEVQRLVLHDLPEEVGDIEQEEDLVPGEDPQEPRTPKLTVKDELMIPVEVDHPIKRSMRLKKS